MEQVKKAWEYAREIVEHEKPFPERAARVVWDDVLRDGQRDLWQMNYLWGGNVTESLMPLFFIAQYLQEYANLGYDVSEAEAMIPEGIELHRQKQDIALYRHTCRVMNTLYNSPKLPDHPHWKYTEYKTFQQYAAAVNFPEYPGFSITREELFDKVYAGWMAQVCAGAVGTAIEGYHTKNLEAVYGWVDRYIKDPEMYNDDLTFELAFLETFKRKGYALTGADVAEDWAARLPFAFTAEGIALKNIKNGIYPPESGQFHNPFCEMIGAQMRGGVCGMAAPGDPKMAAKLAWEDAIVSHHNNGVLGEIFNAVMVSLAFVEKDVKKVCRMAIDLMPDDSEYRTVVEYAWKKCEEYGNWRDAWLDCDEKYKHYSWIHAYPNAAAEVVALYFCENDYDKLVSLIAMCGLDVDCNAAQVANIIAVMQGMACIGEKWTEPIGDYMATYVRGMETVRFKALAQQTVDAILRARQTDV
ncbi:MAG: ADP-ribosylglycohydrolase family protein [Ruthenibacterium sp.]